MLDAERIIFQYPIYWVAMPGFAKSFIDETFEMGFAWKMA
jgi:putative NADPH-quinone reductase